MVLQRYEKFLLKQGLAWLFYFTGVFFLNPVAAAGLLGAGKPTVGRLALAATEPANATFMVSISEQCA
ncbi:hypothetical protein [Hymenobacter glaciei]|uniref:hypothetical protein n=1 Tax=Hymenobacter glaciei TaxID=877209 RepID=UPI0031EF7B5A